MQSETVFYLRHVEHSEAKKTNYNWPKYQCHLIGLLTVTALRLSRSVGVQFITFDYDIEKAVKAIEESPLLNEYAEMLRMGH